MTGSKPVALPLGYTPIVLLIWQAGRDSNPHRAVLETAVLAVGTTDLLYLGAVCRNRTDDLMLVKYPHRRHLTRQLLYQLS